MMEQPKQRIIVQFEMNDPEGTAPVRVVAGHAQRVAEGWAALSEAMFELADSLDRLVAGGDVADLGDDDD